MKTIAILTFATLILACGCAAGVTEAEYQNMVSERDSLAARVAELEKMLDGDAEGTKIEAAPQSPVEPSTEESGGQNDDEPSPSVAPGDYLTLGDTFDFDGFRITLDGPIGWDAVSNRYSDKDGHDVFKVAITLENLGDDTNSLSSSRYTMFGSSGTKLDSVRAYFRDSLGIADDMRAGAELTKYLYFLYDGDGDYYIEFDDRRTKVEVVIPIIKE